MAFFIPPSVLENQAPSALQSPSFRNNITPGDVGILKSTLLPSFSLYYSLSLATYLAAEVTDRVELKDWLWPSAQVLNAWWTAIGHPILKHKISFREACEALPWSERVLLSCVTIWGVRLFARIACRSLSRGTDDARYDAAKKERNFWRRGFMRVFFPEAVILSVISLPFTVPFTMGGATLPIGNDGVNVVRALGVGLFAAGFALEAMADTQLALHRRERTDLCRHGVWSLVRHPNYLGDTLVHFSFALLNMAGPFNPVVILGPVTNYLFLRYVGGDKEIEASQEERYRSQDSDKYRQLQQWQEEKNSFWPNLRDLANPWTLAVVGSGFIGVVAEEWLRGVYDI
ncbi:hypothetical protein DTO013E5_5718 [Penicillium roqueforti]|uniref:Steroid 5-alpha reductase C-terminal domain-containing protein n=1 Tax=Penicillium roqueforti (strain FM164) TaxID=1365484 RepID=W6QAN1_PENRF|nr:uncharacterized protein LCP9604111_7940 [Penicillium roqueforti]CDM33091.1 Protein of unknown function DUF1295 [Penicillium roqueforti FM164]KAF9242757.1 hypothetical protein LCP9604111_7940 [Penicillium roqueforti]KAI1830537.1 hypothetical protein CBS147337_8603 [Penicillium roqueforti]KAI2674379.1 hypothetical protein CBS147355_6993 [Penicillium roqueforti]KAI2683964.1 hypothetical protein LCP963914a_5794 [Penicillium roqueforti]